MKVKNFFPWRFSSLGSVQSVYLVTNPQTVSTAGMHFKTKQLLFVFVSLGYTDLKKNKIIILKNSLLQDLERIDRNIFRLVLLPGEEDNVQNSLPIFYHKNTWLFFSCKPAKC